MPSVNKLAPKYLTLPAWRVPVEITKKMSGCFFVISLPASPAKAPDTLAFSFVKQAGDYQLQHACGCFVGEFFLTATQAPADVQAAGRRTSIAVLWAGEL